MFKRNAKFDADFLLYSLSHFECDGHTAHMLTQWCLLSPLTSTVKSSLFTHVHSSPLSLAARLHGCHRNHCYINNGWTFSKQTVCVCVCVCVERERETLRQNFTYIYMYKMHIYICIHIYVFTYINIYFKSKLCV